MGHIPSDEEKNLDRLIAEWILDRLQGMIHADSRAPGEYLSTLLLCRKARVPPPHNIGIIDHHSKQSVSQRFRVCCRGRYNRSIEAPELG